jgi:hypothetical protein
LNGKLVEDKYYPYNSEQLGSCDNFETRINRLLGDDVIFGADKTFRDTESCRELVTNYICYFWGSDNEMYDNRCGVDSVKPPCRSLCALVAKTCANNGKWIDLCESIKCPPIDEECTPDPDVNPAEACNIQRFRSIKNSAGRPSPGLWLALTATLLVTL